MGRNIFPELQLGPLVRVARSVSRFASLQPGPGNVSGSGSGSTQNYQRLRLLSQNRSNPKFPRHDGLASVNEWLYLSLCHLEKKTMTGHSLNARHLVSLLLTFGGPWYRPERVES